MTQDLYITKKSLELEWQQEHLKSGKHNIRMIEINKQIQDVIKRLLPKNLKQILFKLKYTIPSLKFR